MDKSFHLDDFVVLTNTISEFSEFNDNYFIKEKEKKDRLVEVEKKIKQLTEELEEKKNTIESLENVLIKQKNESKKILEEHHKLKKRHTELLKMMNELLKIKTVKGNSNTDNIDNKDELDNLDEIRDKIIKTLYNELRRHTVLPFTAMIGNYNHQNHLESKPKSFDL